MKRRTKYLAGVAFATLLSFLLFSFSCSSSEGKSANTAFADTAPAVAIAKDSLAVAEAMQILSEAQQTTEEIYIDTYEEEEDGN